MLLAHKLRYLPGERDMVILAHEVVTEPLGTATSSTTHNQEVHKSTLIAYGEPNGSSAMARTVGLPLASATLHVLDGDVSIRGVAAPVESEIYSPVLADLRKEGLVLCEGIGMKSMAQELTQDLKTLP
jgi:alpha-aminoadipic semialdehyde synthase